MIQSEILRHGSSIALRFKIGTEILVGTSKS